MEFRWGIFPDLREDWALDLWQVALTIFVYHGGNRPFMRMTLYDTVGGRILATWDV